MTRTEDVDAAIERAQDPHAMYASQNLEADNELLAEEVVRLREAMRGLREELDLAIAEMESFRAAPATSDRNRQMP